MAIPYEMRAINRLASKLIFRHNLGLGDHFTHRSDLPKEWAVDPRIKRKIKKASRKWGLNHKLVRHRIFQELAEYDCMEGVVVPYCDPGFDDEIDMLVGRAIARRHIG